MVKTETAKKTAKRPRAKAPVAAAEAAPIKSRKPGVTDRYFEGVGRRKTAIARVKLFTRGDRTITVNGRTVDGYFPTPTMREMAKAALTKMNVEDKFRVVTMIQGGGPSAQAEAMRHGTARALLLFNPEFRKRLKRAGFLTRDPRMVERKHPGKKKARRSPQWSKR